MQRTCIVMTLFYNSQWQCPLKLFTNFSVANDAFIILLMVRKWQIYVTVNAFAFFLTVCMEIVRNNILSYVEPSFFNLVSKNIFDL